MKKNINYYLNHIARALVVLFPILLFLGNAFVEICISTVAILFLLRSFLLKDFAWLKYTWVRLVLAFWLYTVIRGLFAHDPWLSVSTAFVYLRFIFFAVAISHWVGKLPNSQKFFLKSSLITLAFIVINTLIQFILGYDLFGNVIDYASSPRLLTPTGKLAVGIMMSSIVFPVIAFLLHLIINNQTRLLKKLAAILFALAIVATIYVSGERSAFIGLVIGLMLLVLLDKKIRRFSLYIIAACVVALIFLSLYNGKVSFRQFDWTYQELYNFKHSSYGRIYSKGLELFNEHPLFGIGTRQYRIECPIKYGKEELCSLHPHNHYIEILVETGIIGGILFFGTMFVWFRDFYYHRRIIQASFLGLGAAITVFIKLIPILPSASLYIAWASAGFWLMLGWVYACIGKKL